MRHVSKAFGSNLALADVSITVDYGEVHALVGENGAGKSTLMRVLAGHVAADRGTMVLEGHDVDLQHNAIGNRPGIGFVEQEGGLIAEFSGAENLIISEGRGLKSNRRHASRRLRALAGQFGGSIDPEVPVHALPIGQRQRLEILIALARGVQILILDEPTAALSIDDAKRLRDIIRKFVGDGGSVFYISHKLNEIKDIADQVTVLRRGAVVGHHRAGSVTVNQLAAEMVGEINLVDAQPQARTEESASGGLIEVALSTRTEVRGHEQRQAVVSLRNVAAPSPYRAESDLADVSLAVHAGEVVGIAGVIGNGQATLAEVLAGLIPPHLGTIERAPGPIAYVPEDRHRDAVALSLSIRDNLMVHDHRRPEFAFGLWSRERPVVAHVEAVLQTAGVRGAHRDSPLASLSGGNQQKLVLGRELEQNPVLLIVHNPFRGLDLRATRNVGEAIMRACRGGAGVVIISSDLEEILQISHRVVVLFSGRIMGEVVVGEGSPELLGEMMGGLR